MELSEIKEEQDLDTDREDPKLKRNNNTAFFGDKITTNYNSNINSVIGTSWVPSKNTSKRSTPKATQQVIRDLNK
jgi:hypothetical protein